MSRRSSDLISTSIAMSMAAFSALWSRFFVSLYLFSICCTTCLSASASHTLASHITSRSFLSFCSRRFLSSRTAIFIPQIDCLECCCHISSLLSLRFERSTSEQFLPSNSGDIGEPGESSASCPTFTLRYGVRHILSIQPPSPSRPTSLHSSAPQIRLVLVERRKQQPHAIPLALPTLHPPPPETQNLSNENANTRVQKFKKGHDTC